MLLCYLSEEYILAYFNMGCK